MAMNLPVSEIEKENLEAHVEICWQRYQRLHDRLEDVDHKVDTLSENIKELRLENLQEMREIRQEHSRENRGLKQAIIMSAATIVASLIGLIAVLLKMHG